MTTSKRPGSKKVNSAGIVLYRRRPALEILLVHPGGPFWANKDEHGWSIPKGEYDPETEDARQAAVREFEEETGHRLPEGSLTALTPFKAGRKTIAAWLVEGDLDPETISSNSFEMEWPPRSGTMQSFPEVDRAAWFPLDRCRSKLHKGQAPLCALIATALTPAADESSTGPQPLN